jgi:hypothetical protein
VAASVGRARSNAAPDQQALPPLDRRSTGVAGVRSTSLVVAAKRSGDTHTPYHPSQYIAARRTAAGDRPPMTTGTGGSATGRMRAPANQKNSPM